MNSLFLYRFRFVQSLRA